MSSGNQELKDICLELLRQNTILSMLLKETTELKSGPQEAEQQVQEEELEQEAEQQVQEERETRQKVKRKIRKLRDFIVDCPRQESYTPQEVSELLPEDYNLIAEWIRIRGLPQLYCTHCKKDKNVADNWVESIRKCCMKDGLNSETRIPKTCDHQQRVNARCNPFNNIAYPLLKNDAVPDASKCKILKIKKKYFERIGKKINPHKYEQFV